MSTQASKSKVVGLKQFYLLVGPQATTTSTAICDEFELVEINRSYKLMTVE